MEQSKKHEWILRNAKSKAAYYYSNENFDSLAKLSKEKIKKGNDNIYSIEYYIDDVLIETVELTDYFDSDN